MSNTIERHELIPDRRSLSKTISDASRSPAVRGTVYILFAILITLVPLLTLFLLLLMSPVLFCDKRAIAPVRLPIESKMTDFNDPLPGGEGFHLARGAVYLGNERETNREVWVSWNDQRLHDYILGTTGSGKSEVILAILANYSFAGSGFLLGDGKGTMLFPRQTETLARMAGADDDNFVISFLSGYKEVYDRSPRKRSHTINPFGEGNAASVKELLTSLMSDGGGDNAIFADGAASLADSLSPAWVEGRNKKLFNLDITYINQSLALEQVFNLSVLEGLSDLPKRHIRNYLMNLGYNFESTPSKQPENVTKMHGYYVNYFMRVVTSFAISYRHIYFCEQGEVNLRDCVQSHRNLTFTLPSLEKSGAEVKNLGKTLLTAAKAASSFGLGETMEGKREAMIENLPANHPTPYKFAFDEFSFYVIEDFSLLPAQFRGINLSFLLGAQDFKGTERAGEIDAESLLGNARTKLFGALEDVYTWQKLKELISEVDMLVYNRFNNKGAIMNRFIPEMEVQHTRRVPLEMIDVQNQVEGQFCLLNRGKISKIKTFYPNITASNITDNYYLIRLVTAFAPTPKKSAHLRLLNNFVNILCQERALLATSPLLLETNPINDYSGDLKAISGLRNFASRSRFSLAARLDEDSSPEPELFSDNIETSVSDVQDDSIVQVQHDNPVSTSEAIDDAINEWNQSAELGLYINNDDQATEDLLEETQAAAEEYFENNSLPGTEGVYALTERECDEIENRYLSLSKLLGFDDNLSQENASNIIGDIRKKVFYLIPPKPSADPDIKAKVAKLMGQADLFE
jgi:intracellular multiplication protein IcmO